MIYPLLLTGFVLVETLLVDFDVFTRLFTGFVLLVVLFIILLLTGLFTGLFSDLFTELFIGFVLFTLVGFEVPTGYLNIGIYLSIYVPFPISSVPKYFVLPYKSSPFPYCVLITSCLYQSKLSGGT